MNFKEPTYIYLIYVLVVDPCGDQRQDLRPHRHRKGGHQGTAAMQPILFFYNGFGGRGRVDMPRIKWRND